MVPLSGGIGGGPGSVTLDPGRRAFLRLDGGSPGEYGPEFQMKVYKPGFGGFVDRFQYGAAVVRRGQHVSLRTHDCDVSESQNLTT